MPQAFTTRNYSPGNYYHVYQEGLEGRTLFADTKDFAKFSKLLEKTLQSSSSVSLVAYSLLPNHFHLMLKLNAKEGITKLLRRVLTAYAMYFNAKYNHRGTIFRGKPKGAIVTDQSQILHLTRYIHQKPSKLAYAKSLKDYKHSSYRDYLGLSNHLWVRHEEILKFFRSARKTSEKDMLSYESFVENPLTDSKEKLGKLSLDHD